MINPISEDPWPGSERGNMNPTAASASATSPSTSSKRKTCSHFALKLEGSYKSNQCENSKTTAVTIRIL